jgi:hypothetical protein
VRQHDHESPDRVLDALEKLLQKPPPLFTDADLRLDPMYDPVRNEPRFKALLARTGADPRLSPAAAIMPSAKGAPAQQSGP